MSTLVRDIERPAFLDRPVDGQLSLGGVGTSEAHHAPSAHVGKADPVPLSDRLRHEQLVRATAGAAAHARTDTARGGEATLDELFVGAWEGLSARRPVACPVCTGTMRPRAGAVGGACADCGVQMR